MKVYIDRKVYQKIMHWVDKAEGEVSGMGSIVKGPGYMRVVSACMLPQENGATSTDLDADGVAKAMYLLRNEPGEMNFWWHSHVNMGVFWSGTDTATIEELGRNGFLLATVFNKKREMRSALWYQSPYKDESLGDHMFLDELETQIFDSLTKEEVTAWDEEYTRNIIEKKYKSIYDSNRWSASGYRATGYPERGEDGRFLGLSKRERKRLKKQGKTGITGTGTLPFTRTSKAELVDQLADEIDYDEVEDLSRFNDDGAPRLSRDTIRMHSNLLEATEQDLPMTYMGFPLNTFEDLAELKEMVLAGEL